MELVFNKADRRCVKCQGTYKPWYPAQQQCSQVCTGPGFVPGPPKVVEAEAEADNPEVRVATFAPAAAPQVRVMDMVEFG